MSNSQKCLHQEVNWTLQEHRFGDTNLRYLEVTGRCTACEAVVAFRGASLGLSPDRPTCEPGGAEIRLPFLFGDEPLAGRPPSFSIKGLLQ